MNNYSMALDPGLKLAVVKPPKPANAAVNAGQQDCRELFYALIHISENYHVLPQAHSFLKQHFQSANEHYAANFSLKYSANSLANLLKQATPELHESNLPESAFNECLVQYAPVYFTEFSWLTALSTSATCQNPLIIDLMATTARLTKGDQGIAQSRSIYLAHLLATGVELPDLHTLAFARQGEVIDKVFEFASIQLALAQFPRVFFPEILGFTLSFCQAPSLPEQIFPGDDDKKLPEFISHRSLLRHQEASYVTDVIRAYLAEYETQADSLWQRLQTGFWLHQQQLGISAQRINARLHTILSPRQAVEKLLSTLIPHAVGHHGKVRLGSKTIDEWFREKPFKSANFLATLLHSPFVDRARPEQSKLLKLFEFNGPMFGVLDEQGKAVFRDWLLSELNPGFTQAKKNKPANYKVGLKSIAGESAVAGIAFKSESPDGSQAARAVDYPTLSNRELYYYLVNNELYPDVLTTAKHRANRVLAKANWFSRLPFGHYSHHAFDGYIEAIYQREVAKYKPLAKKPKLSKNTYIWGIEQFAPTILTDGSWLQGMHQLVYYSNHTVGALLQKIYGDEIGNGKLPQNHPHIYQELLDSVNIKLPPILSQDFVGHTGFIASAFDIPVYLMAISRFPSAFLPELLGLNMAIELSGLGNGYLRLSEELRFWGINSAIVDIHTSIDNLSSGHAALAVKTIQLYLDEILACSGDDIMQAHWRRMYTGFCSLESVSRRFKYALIAKYLLNRSQLESDR